MHHEVARPVAFREDAREERRAWWRKLTRLAVRYVRRPYRDEVAEADVVVFVRVPEPDLQRGRGSVNASQGR